ncbi:MAG: efflux transporter periplasmic adaptor subunit, partial [Armatimonadetes bacterium]|nr:efflux transporter periplasmic adaptor subunit [Armatimonadota bacterium]
MRRFLIVAGVVVVLVIVGLVVVRQRRARPADTSASQIVTVQRGAVRRTVSADGTLRALTTVEVKSDAGGRVLLLAVDVGDKVKRGDL